MANPVPVYRLLASTLGALSSCESARTQYKWSDDHYNAVRQAHGDRIAKVIRNLAPSGSGFDNGTLLDIDKSTDSRLVFTTSYHHMNDVGFYDGWTDHRVVVTPSFYGVDIRISGRNRNEVKDLIHDVFHSFLTTETEY